MPKKKQITDMLKTFKQLSLRCSKNLKKKKVESPKMMYKQNETINKEIGNPKTNYRTIKYHN